jgi:hypothetical protein
MDIPEVQSVVDKLAHKKFFVALFAIWVLGGLVVPENLEIYRLVGIVLVTVSAIGAQTWLDKGETK